MLGLGENPDIDHDDDFRGYNNNNYYSCYYSNDLGDVGAARHSDDGNTDENGLSVIRLTKFVLLQFQIK